MSDLYIFEYRKQMAAWMRKLADRIETDQLQDMRVSHEPQFGFPCYEDPHGVFTLGPVVGRRYVFDFTLREPLVLVEQRPDRIRNW